MIYDLAKKHPDAGGDLLKFYFNKYNKILNIDSFVKLPPIYQISIIKEFLQTKNIGFITDLYNVNVFYIDPRINANNILKHFNEKGKLTDIIIHLNFDIKESFTNVTDSDIYAINYIFDNILIPF